MNKPPPPHLPPTVTLPSPACVSRFTYRLPAIFLTHLFLVITIDIHTGFGSADVGHRNLEGHKTVSAEKKLSNIDVPHTYWIPFRGLSIAESLSTS